MNIMHCVIISVVTPFKFGMGFRMGGSLRTTQSVSLISLTIVKRILIDFHLDIPPDWSAQDMSVDKVKLGTSKTLTALKAARKSANVADPSFDLDGDGAVGIRDYFVASRFDKDRDGKLDEQERATCVKALEDGYEKRFKFGLESAPLAAHRNQYNVTDLAKVRVM